MPEVARQTDNVFPALKQMKKKYPNAKFAKHVYDKHRRLLAELPEKGGSKATKHIQPQPDVGVDPGLQFEPGKQRVASKH